MQKQIFINAEIFSDNLGDGISGNYVAEHSLAEYMKKIWTTELKEYGAEIVINIIVQPDTSGCSRETSVDAIGFEDNYGIEKEIEEKLSNKDYIKNPYPIVEAKEFKTIDLPEWVYRNEEGRC